jgi:hypothetical protein
MKKILSLFAATLLLLGMISVLPVHAQVATMYVDPATVNFNTDTAYVGMRFNVTVWLSGYAAHTGGAQVYMEFNPTIVNATRWFEPKTDTQYIFYGFTTKALPTSFLDVNYYLINPNLARILLGLLLDPVEQPPGGAGTGKILIVEFEVKQLPPKLGNLTTTLNIDSLDTYFIDYDTGTYYGDGAGEVTKNNCVYTITWKAPSSPKMGLDLDTATAGYQLLREFGPYPPSAIGQAFDVNVLIKGLSEAWYLTSDSFDLVYNATVIDVLGDNLNVTINTLWGTSTVTFTRDPAPDVLDKITINVSSPTSNPSGDVLVATIKFTVMMQQSSPPAPVGTFDKSDLTFANVEFYDHVGPIPPGTSETGTVKVYALIALPMPWFKVEPALVELGPAPSIGDTFWVNVRITGPAPDGLSPYWYLVGVQFSLFYDPSLIEVEQVVEGGFLKNGPWNQYGTFFVGTVEPDDLGSHVLVGVLLLPNPSTGEWDMTNWPNGTGVIAAIQFRAIKQDNVVHECDLHLEGVFGQWAIDRNGDYIPVDESKNVDGLYRMLALDRPGRNIDLYGGAKNAGYWTGYPEPFPEPYGGQGPNHWMDLVFPQSEITLYAYVTYNYWPVQSKDVGFEIEGPYTKLENGTIVPAQTWKVWAKLTATTDENGVARITYRMPWPCNDPDSITGIWKVTATATVADVLINDTMLYYYERPVYITKVTLDKDYYIHGEDITVTVEYRTHAAQIYPVLFSVVATDELGVPFGMALKATTIGGALPWCTWKTGKFTVTINIPKWAYAGIGTIHVNAYDKDPTAGGFAYVPEYTPAPTFQIGPYAL